MKKITFILFILSIQGLYSQEIITDRPDQTESSSTVPKKSLQIESGFQLMTNTKGLLVEKQVLLPTTLFRIGVFSWMEIRLLNQLEYFQQNKDSSALFGLSDIEIGTKIQLFKRANSKTEIAFLSHLVLPTGTFSRTKNELGSINKLSISHSHFKNVDIGYNIGYNYFGHQNGDLTYSLAIGFGINEKLSVYLEPYGEVIDFKQNETNFDLGLTYLVKQNVQIDFSFGLGVTQRMNYVSAGFSWLILN